MTTNKTKIYDFAGYKIKKEVVFVVTTPEGKTLNGKVEDVDQAKNLIKFHLAETIGNANAETLIQKAELKEI